MIKGIGILLQMSPFIKFSEPVLCGGGTQERHDRRVVLVLVALSDCTQ